MKPFSKKNLLWASAWGIALCLFQVLLCLTFAPKEEGLGKAYLRLNQWDSFHYIDIIEKGYRLPPGQLTGSDVHSNRANVGYFPAYPMAVKGLKSVFDLSVPLSAVVTAQIFCCLWWIQLLLLFRLYGLSDKNALLGAFTILCYPASFYLVAGYSESLFMASMIGLVLWTEIWVRQKSKSGWAWGFAAISGFALSSSRLVGIPLAIYPVLRLGAEHLSHLRYRRMDAFWMGILSFIAVMGGFSFFIYCYWEFGQWDLYLKLQRLGWGNQPNYFALFDPRSYFPKLFFEDTTTSVCKASNLLMLVLFLRILLKDSLRKNWIRLSLGFIAFVQFFVSLSGKADYNMDSMVRYNFPVFALLVLLYWDDTFQVSALRRWSLGFALFIALQIWMVLVFTKGGWIA